ncbi:Hypothetical protein UVM_LOCUS11, partial [uncultured virus]
VARAATQFALVCFSLCVCPLSFSKQFANTPGKLVWHDVIELETNAVFSSTVVATLVPVARLNLGDKSRPFLVYHFIELLSLDFCRGQAPMKNAFFSEIMFDCLQS